MSEKKLKGKDVIGVEREFKKWRGKNRKGSTIPEELWAKAVRIGRKHGVNPISAQLRLNYYALKKRMKVQRHAPSIRKPSQNKFVEVSGNGLRRRPICTVEVQDETGKRLRVEMDGVRFGEVEELARKLWRGKR